MMDALQHNFLLMKFSKSNKNYKQTFESALQTEGVFFHNLTK